ncbi:MAG: RNA 2',3'-cyclic phosphodiesterase [Dehalococcoidia bacterium]|nr:RNA 2',3'-cyclic phosphodiesterase [Dehalococcoidia bacterium]
MSKLRLFVALDPGDAIKGEMTRLQEALRHNGCPPLKWTRPEGIHITIKFLGHVDEERIGAIGTALEEACSHVGRITLQPGSVSTFGGRSPRVVWAGLDGDLERLSSLQRSVDDALSSLGFMSENRTFNPHLTIARVPDRLPPGELRSIVAAVAAVERAEPLQQAFGEALLVRSILDPGGAVYSTLAAFRLDAGHPVARASGR